MFRSKSLRWALLLVIIISLIAVVVIYFMKPQKQNPYDHLQLMGEVLVEDEHGTAEVKAFQDENGELYFNISQFFAFDNEHNLVANNSDSEIERLGNIISEDGKIEISVDRQYGQIVLGVLREK